MRFVPLGVAVGEVALLACSASDRNGFVEGPSGPNGPAEPGTEGGPAFGEVGTEWR